MSPAFPLIMIVGSVAACVRASYKGRNVMGWAVLGALFPLIAAIAIHALPSLHREE